MKSLNEIIAEFNGLSNDELVEVRKELEGKLANMVFDEEVVVCLDAVNEILESRGE